MGRISALEAQLDHYRHGVDEEAIAARGRAEARARMLQAQGQEELERRDVEISDLLDQQNLLTTQLIEKEEQVNGLLKEVQKLNDLEAENAQLRQFSEESRKEEETMGT